MYGLDLTSEMSTNVWLDSRCYTALYSYLPDNASSPNGNAPVKKRNRTANGIKVKPSDLAKYASMAVGTWTSFESRVTMMRGENIKGTA